MDTMTTPIHAAKAGHTPEIKPIPLSQVNAQMEFYKQAVAERDRLREVLSRILAAHDSKNNGAVMGEAVLCKQFAAQARAALKDGK